MWGPDQFSYPWGIDWQSGGPHSPRLKRRRPHFKSRRLSAFERKMLDRITSKRRPSEAELGIHPLQPTLWEEP